MQLIPKKHPAIPPLLTLVCGILFISLPSAPPAHAADMCKTPDGFFMAAAKQPAKPADKGNDGDDKNGRGMGGTGIYAEGKGIGGTGIRFTEGGKGMGGTGISFDGSVIVKGRVTGFGSVCVNGLEIHYAKSTPVSSGEGAMTTDKLRIGDIVTILAAPQKDGLHAQQIALDHILSGKVSSIDTRRGIAEIGGKSVMIGHAPSSIKPGDTVLVSGFKDTTGRIVASLIEKTAHTAPLATPDSSIRMPAQHAVLQGYPSAKGGAEHHFRMGDTTVVLGKDTAIVGGKMDDIGADSRVLVFGDISGGQHVEADMIVIEHKEIEAEVLSLEREVESIHSGQEDHATEHDDEDSQENSDIPESEGIETEAPETESPEVEAPEVETPEIETPEIETPEVETPEIETPEVETPEVDPPEIDLPDTGN